MLHYSFIIIIAFDMAPIFKSLYELHKMCPGLEVSNAS